jgi:hypothetical protein
MAKKTNGVDIPKEYKIKPDELEAAWVLVRHYKTDVKVLKPSDRFMQKTADFIIYDTQYELKTPSTSNVDKIERMIRRATKQSGNVILDIQHTKITEKRMTEIIKDRLLHIKKLKTCSFNK